MMVATRGTDTLGDGTAAELCGPDKKGVLQHASLLEILDERRHRAIHRGRLGVVILTEVFMAIPIDSGTSKCAAIDNLHEAHTPFEKSTGHQAVAGESFVGRIV